MNRILYLILLSAPILFIFSCDKSPSEQAETGEDFLVFKDWCITNWSEYEIDHISIELLKREYTFDSFPLRASRSVSFPKKFPDKATIKYEIRTETYTKTVDLKELKEVFKQYENTHDISLYFMILSKDKVAAKLYVEPGDSRHPIRDGVLYPDFKEIEYIKYKKLLTAAYDGDLEEMKRLLETNAPLHWDDPQWLTPFEWTARWGRYECFDYLYTQCRALITEDEIYFSVRMAAQENYIPILKTLLSDIDIEKVPPYILQGWLKVACEFNHSPEACQYFVETIGIDVDFETSDVGHTLLFTAVLSGRKDTVEYLLNIGANPEVKLDNKMLLGEFDDQDSESQFSILDAAKRTPEIEILIREFIETKNAEGNTL